MKNNLDLYEAVKIAKSIKKRGGVGTIKIGLSNSEKDTINRSLRESEKIIKYLSNLKLIFK